MKTSRRSIGKSDTLLGSFADGYKRAKGISDNSNTDSNEEVIQEAAVAQKIVPPPKVNDAAKNQTSQYCKQCNERVEPKTKYRGPLWAIGFITWVIAGYIFNLYDISGAWGFVVALLVARIFSGRFKTFVCPKCQSKDLTAVEESKA